MAGKLSDKRKRISSAQSKELIAQVQEIADKNGLSFTDALRLAMEAFVKANANANENKNTNAKTEK